MFHCNIRFLSPISVVPLVALSGFGLYELGFPGVCSHFSDHLIPNLHKTEFILL